MILYKEELGRTQSISQSTRQFYVDVLIPFKDVVHPKFGEFLLVKTSEVEAGILRVTSTIPAGQLKSQSGDEYQVALAIKKTDLPDYIKSEHLWYVYKCMILGAIKFEEQKLSFYPGIRKAPFLGLNVNRPSDDVLKFLANIGTNLDSPIIGKLSLGNDLALLNNGDEVSVKFDLTRLISKRTFVFSRAGYGKSNFVKLLTTRLREQLNTGKEKCGILIFDPEGEYAYMTKSGTPGFADIKAFNENLVVFTNRHIKDEFYKKFIGGVIKLDLRTLDPREISDILFVSSTSDAQWKSILNAFGGRNIKWWRYLIDQLTKGESPNVDFYKENLKILENFSAWSFYAFFNRLRKIIQQLHSPESTLMDQVLYHLKLGNVVILDISILSDSIAGHIIELTLKKIFEFNQEKYIAEDENEMINTIIVIEEAQNSLGKISSDDLSPVVRWAKEGRKYKLGGIYITQQPSAIQEELLSQGDNFFAMHLINSKDLAALNRVNSHFSEDILTYLVSEPILGNAYFWSAPYQPYIISVKIDQFDKDIVLLSNIEKKLPIKNAIDLHKNTVQDIVREFAKRVREGKGLYRVVDDSQSLKRFTRGRRALAIKLYFARILLGEVLDSFKGFEHFLEITDGKKIASESFTLDKFIQLGWLLSNSMIMLKHYGGRNASKNAEFWLLDSENVKPGDNLSGNLIPILDNKKVNYDLFTEDQEEDAVDTE